MIIDARVATEADLPLVVEMAAAAIEELRPLRGGAVWAETDARTEPLLDGFRDEHGRTDAVVLVGTIDGAPVGYGAAHRHELHSGEAMARITDLYVMPEARKVGVGEALILAIEAWAADNGLVALDSLALPGDRDTKNFFETFGLVARALQVNRRLDR